MRSSTTGTLTGRRRSRAATSRPAGPVHQLAVGSTSTDDSGRRTLGEVGRSKWSRCLSRAPRVGARCLSDRYELVTCRTLGRWRAPAGLVHGAGQPLGGSERRRERSHREETRSMRLDPGIGLCRRDDGGRGQGPTEVEVVLPATAGPPRRRRRGDPRPTAGSTCRTMLRTGRRSGPDQRRGRAARGVH